MASVFLSLSILGLVVAPAPHDLPDGSVKVATQVIVQADSTSIRYDVGFNPTTLDQLLEAYDVKPKDGATAAEKTSAFRKAFKEKIAESIKLKVDDHDVKIQEVTVDDNEVSKHVQARFNLKFEVLVKKEAKLEIHDTSFNGMARTWNAGLKAALPIAVKESSVRAIPLRSKAEQRSAEEAEPFVISGTVMKLSIDVESEEKTSMAPLFVLAFSLGGAGMVGLLLVPNEEGGDDHHDHH